MPPIIVARARLGLGLALLFLAAGRASLPPADLSGDATPLRRADPALQPLPASDALARDLASPDEARAMMAVYAACRLPPPAALAIAEEAVAVAPSRQAQALARIVRDCALPAEQAIAELEAILSQDPSMAAVAVLELHRLNARGSAALAEKAGQAERDLAVWLAAYSLSVGGGERR